MVAVLLLGAARADEVPTLLARGRRAQSSAAESRAMGENDTSVAENLSVTEYCGNSYEVCSSYEVCLEFLESWTCAGSCASSEACHVDYYYHDDDYYYYDYYYYYYNQHHHYCDHYDRGHHDRDQQDHAHHHQRNQQHPCDHHDGGQQHHAHQRQPNEEHDYGDRGHPHDYDDSTGSCPTCADRVYMLAHHVTHVRDAMDRVARQYREQCGCLGPAR